MNAVRTNGNGLRHAMPADRAPATGAAMGPRDPATQARPTLVIGLGTVGCEAATWFKATWQALPDEGVPVRVLGFDAADEPIVVPGLRGAVALEPNVEFFNIGHVPVAKIKDNLAHHPAIAERLGAVLQSLPPVTLRGNGAKQNPALGLLCWLWHQALIERRMTEAIGLLAGREYAQVGLGASVNCFIFAGTSGGSGHGAVFETGYLTRALFDELGPAGDFCHITLVALLPDAYRGVDGPFLKANAGGFLRELEQAMMRGGFSARYPSGRVIESSRAPFDLVVLADGIDERGHTWTSVHEICRMVGEAAVLQSRSQVGRRGANSFDNLDQILTQGTPDGQGTFAASLNVATLHFDGPAVARRLARESAATTAREALLAPARPATIAGLAADGLALLSVETLPERLRRDSQGMLLQVEAATLPGWIARRGGAARVRDEIGYVRDYLRTRVENDFPLAVEQAAGRVEAEMAAALDGWAAGVAGGSLPRAEEALVRLGEQLTELALAVGRERVVAQTEAERLLEQLPALEAALLGAAGANFLVREERIAAAESPYLQTAQAAGEARLRATLAGAEADLLQRLRVRLGRQEALLARARATLAEAVPLLASPAAGGTPNGTAIELADDGFLTELRAAHTPQPEEALRALLGLPGAPLAWAGLDADVLAETLAGALAGSFAPVARMGVEQAVAARSEAITPAAWQAALLRLAAPSWNLEQARLTDGGAGLARVTVLGVPQAEHSIFRDQAASLVSTGDPTRVIAFQMVAGAPLSALATAPVLDRAVRAVSSRHTPYVLPAFLSASSDHTATFALAAIFGLITTRGIYFYYRPADALDEPRRLAQGLSGALAAFGADETLAREALARVEAEIAAIGLRAALARLDAYVAEEGVDELTRSMKKAVRGYARRLEQAAREAEQFKPAR